jgi:alanine--tRNA ligase
MKKISSNELRDLYFKFFEVHNHKIIPSASVIPENDPTVLFTMAGMQPLVPYLMGEKHPLGVRLAGVQKCIRTVDIDTVGDASHLTSFEMLGNWSLGDYFKKESIHMSYEFLTSDEYLALDKDKLYFTCFSGDEDFPKDDEAYNYWLEEGVDPSHIFYLPKENNFWILGSGVGPCGPDTEIFYDTGKGKCSDNCDPSCDCGKYVEIWNNVFMAYRRDEEGNLTILEQQNVDTGMGLDRTLFIINGMNSVYDTDLFTNLRSSLEEYSNMKYSDNEKSFRIIMDHVRTAVFILGDINGVVPSNVGQGYILRRLLRRAIRHIKKLNIDKNILKDLAIKVIEDNSFYYPEIKKNEEFIFIELEKEENKFNKTLKDGEKWFYKTIKHINDGVISGSDAFKLFDTFGFPIEFTLELAEENNLKVDIDGFNEAFKHHQEISKTTDQGAFKGGLADDSYETVKYHTAAHLTLAALQQMYGDHIIQKGSNITSERLRFDFNLDHKMEKDEIEKLERVVNENIKKSIPVAMNEMSIDEAREKKVHGQFNDKYDSLVKVYSIGDVSSEICGGPHVNNTNELGRFKIIKEESSGSGVRRIKAVLEEE